MTPMHASQFVAPSRAPGPVAALALSVSLIALSLAGCAMDTGADEAPSESVSVATHLLKAARAPGVQWQRLKVGNIAAQHLTVSKDEHGNVVSSCQRPPKNTESSKP